MPFDIHKEDAGFPESAGAGFREFFDVHFSKFIYSAAVLILGIAASLFYLASRPSGDPLSAATAADAALPEGARYHLVPILCFHNVDGAGPYAVTREKFRAYMEAIRRSGVRVISLRDLYEAAKRNELMSQPSIVITVDDDYKNIVRVAAPILREYNYPATFFFYTRGILPDPRWGTSWQDLRRLHREGFDIQNHSFSHTKFHEKRASEDDDAYAHRVRREIITSREILQKNLPDADLYAFAYPMGFYSDYLRERLLAAGYDLLLTTDSRPVDLSKPFDPTFDRYTIQKFLVKNPEAMFRKQLQYARSPYDAEVVAQSDAVEDDAAGN